MHTSKKRFDIVILTDSRYVDPKQKDWYIDQVILEDQILQNAFEYKKLKVCKKDWSDTDFDWTSAKYAIFRSTWDYFERFDEFFSWIEKTKHKINFINSTESIKWNIDKHYLKDLAKKKINIAPTKFIEKGEKTTLSKLFKKTNWNEAVIKPAISGAARHTYRISIENHLIHEDLFNRLINTESMLFQEFMENITTKGEVSLMMIGGKYTHAIKKMAKKGDFRVQDDYGGSVKAYKASDYEILFAEKCLRKIPYKCIYARVDIIYDNQNNLSLSELELIEPELWFRKNPKSAMILAHEVSKLLSSK